MAKNPLKKNKEPKPDKSIYTIFEDESTGVVQITDEVIATIAAIAATDVEGVAAVGPGITREKAARIGARQIAKAVQVKIADNTITVRIIITAKYGSSIPEMTVKVQKKVKSTLETMTGLGVDEVQVSVADVALDTK